MARYPQWQDQNDQFVEGLHVCCYHAWLASTASGSVRLATALEYSDVGGGLFTIVVELGSCREPQSCPNWLPIRVLLLRKTNQNGE